ncbi:hypothetical protein [Streptomyces eurythermus]
MHNPLPESRVGGIWRRGESIGRCHRGKPELSARVFDARTADCDEGPGRPRTGTPGALVDGEPFVTGRLRELSWSGGTPGRPIGVRT